MGIYVGAGGVKTVNSLYVGAGGVKTVTAVYVGAGGTYKVWPDIYTIDLTTGNEWGWYNYYGSGTYWAGSWGSFVDGSGVYIKSYTCHCDDSSDDDRATEGASYSMRTTNYIVNGNTLSGYNNVTITYTCTSYYSVPLGFGFYCDGSGSLSSGYYNVATSTSSGGLALQNATNGTTSSTLTNNFKSVGSSLVYFFLNHYDISYPANYYSSVRSYPMYIHKIEFS